jgi:long-chain fatty acid transport protein
MERPVHVPLLPGWLPALATHRRTLHWLLCSLSALDAAAEGFRSPTTGTAGLATTGGRIVFVDDASAVFHNPANLLDLDRWEASAEPTIVHHSVEYTAPSGATARTEDPWKLLPHFFVGGPVHGDRVAAGLGVSVPFGLSVDWGSGEALRYIAPRYVQLKTANFNPSVAVRLAEGLHLGAGLDVMYSQLTLSQYVPWSLLAATPGLPDGDLRAQASGIGISGNAALTWKFLPHHRIAATLRAPMDVQYDGDLRGTEVPGLARGELLLPFNTSIHFPTIISLGYGWEVSDNLRLEANAEWIEFSRFDSLSLNLPMAVPGVPPSVRQDWNDTFTFGASATWQVDEAWHLRASYQYFQTPVPEDTFSPTIPDSNQHAVAVGVGFRRGRHRLELAYSRVFYEDREIAQNQNPLYLGRYEIDVHLISAAYGFRF